MRLATLLTVPLLCAAGWKGSTGQGSWTAEVDEYPHGIFRLRMREEGKQVYEVEDVVIQDSLPAPKPAASGGTSVFKAKDGQSMLTLTGKSGSFASVAGSEITFDLAVPEGANPKTEATVAFNQAERLYGIPEHATDLSLKDGKSYRLMNLDVYMYKLDDTGGIYGSIPFMHAHSTEKGTVGFLWLDSSDTNVELKKEEGGGWTTKWSSVTGIHDMFFFPGGTPHELLLQYSSVTGKSAMYPVFGLGYHQCRWNYRSEEDTLAVDEGFDKHNMPYDVIWLDIEHTNGKRYFTWDEFNFPDPARMADKIGAKGRKIVTITDPHIKRAGDYHVHNQAVEGGYYVKTESGADYEGECWSGVSSWLDFYSTKVRNWYATLFSYDSYKGSTPDIYNWIDMNEPSVFKSHEVTMDMNAVHTRDDGYKVKHRELHNMYGFYHSIAAYQGQYQRSLGPPHEKSTRPYLLSRSFFAGSQRYVMVWTGDNVAEWSHLDKSAPMLLAMSVAGLPAVGADVGGFFNNPDAELFTRWYQFGAFYPFFRGHAHLETKRREPWLYGSDTTDRVRRAIVGRYQLMPYIYTQYWRAHKRGDCIIMPLYMMFPKDPKVLDIDRQILFGESIMVKPVVAPGQTTVTMYLPGTDPWYDLYSGAPHAAGQEVTLDAPMEYLPVLVKGGSIIPKRERVRRATAAQYYDPITLVIALSSDQTAAGDLYLDDTHSFEYQQGAFVHRQFTFADSTLSCTKLVDNSPYSTQYPGDMKYETPVEVERVVVFGLNKQPSEVTVAVEGRTAKLETHWDAASKVLTIRKPGVKVATDFKIGFDKAITHDEL